MVKQNSTTVPSSYTARVVASDLQQVGVSEQVAPCCMDLGVPNSAGRKRIAADRKARAAAGHKRSRRIGLVHKTICKTKSVGPNSFNAGAGPKMPSGSAAYGLTPSDLSSMTPSALEAIGQNTHGVCACPTLALPPPIYNPEVEGPFLTLKTWLLVWPCVAHQYVPLVNI